MIEKKFGNITGCQPQRGGFGWFGGIGGEGPFLHLECEWQLWGRRNVGFE